MIFYFIGGFVLIRIWIFLIESESVLVESVGAAVTFLLLIALLLRYRILRNREEEEERQRQLHPEVNGADLALLRSLFRNPQLGLSQEAIDSLLCFKYSPHSKYSGSDSKSTAGTDNNGGPSEGHVIFASNVDIENQTNPGNVHETCCSVCLADYVDGDELMMLPCQHAYHKVCVSEWLQRQSQCPLCKQDVLCMLDQLGRLREIASSPGELLSSRGNSYRELNTTNNINNSSNNESSLGDNGGDGSNSNSPYQALNNVDATPDAATL